MLKNFWIFFIFISFIFPFKDTFVICKMSKDEKCACSGEHSKHSCCKIIKIKKDLNFNLKVPELFFFSPFLYIKDFSIEIFNFFNLNKERFINIHSPPIFLKNLNLLI